MQEKTLEGPLDCKEIQPVRHDWSIPKEISPECSLEGLMLKLQYFGHVMQRADSMEKTLMRGKTEATGVILEPKKIKSATVSIVSPSICHEVMGPDAMN